MLILKEKLHSEHLSEFVTHAHKILRIMGCYWGRDCDATGTLLGRYWDAIAHVHCVPLERPTRPMTAEISQVDADARRRRSIAPDHSTASLRFHPATPLLSMLINRCVIALAKLIPFARPPSGYSRLCGKSTLKIGGTGGTQRPLCITICGYLRNISRHQ